jgi:apolipoprotein D and lipocalin family protein
MSRVRFLLLLVLAACASPKAEVAFRNPETPIFSSAAFDSGKFAGNWRQVAAFSDTPGCSSGAVTVGPGPAGLTVDGSLCLGGKEQRISGPLTARGPGRFGVAGMQDWWILWVDSGYRTMAIGTPSGQFGFILDRGAIAPDRLTAAREIFDFNGYIASRLTPF